ncbi:MAG TPA: dienelactone hydrolase family protein [Terriglobales bacterium]|nr:dienelactone hydrolase family protein [Terriglobales bacterium]
MSRIFRPLLSGILALGTLAMAQSPSAWRYDLRPGDRLVYSYTFQRQVKNDQVETSVEARFHTHVLIAGERGGVISAGFQRNRDSAQLLEFRSGGKDRLASERPKFEKRMLTRPVQFSEAMEFNTVGEPRFSWETVRESPSHLLPALHEIEVLPVEVPKTGSRWQGMNLLGIVFEWAGPEPMHGRRCYRVKGSNSDGSVTLTYWWSPESGVVERVDLDGTYPVPGGTSHEQARMDLESQTRGEAVADWLAKPETRMGALEALLLSPWVPVTAEQLASALRGADAVVQQFALAVAHERKTAMPESSVKELAGSANGEVKALASEMLEPSPAATISPLNCGRPEEKKTEPAKFGTLFHVALPEKPGPGIGYFLRVPLSYRPERPAPLLVYLSGGPGLALDGVNTANDVIAGTDYLVLYPQAGDYWWKPEVAERLDAALRDTFREFNVDRDRVYIAGFSNGGTGALYMAELWPQRFAAAVSLMGAGQCMDEVKQMLPNLANLPLLFVHGEKDGRIAPECSRATRDTIAEQRPRVAPQLRMLPDRDHDITLTSDDGLTLSYLKDKTREAFPKRVNAQLPGAELSRQYWLEVLEKGSGVAEVNAEIKKDNVVEIRSREVKRLRLYLRPEMFPQAGPVRVRWNGKQVFEGPVGDACAGLAGVSGDAKLDFGERKELVQP